MSGVGEAVQRLATPAVPRRLAVSTGDCNTTYWTMVAPSGER